MITETDPILGWVAGTRRKILAVLLLVLVVMLVTAPVALASNQILPDAGGKGNAADTSRYVPLMRWGASTGTVITRSSKGFTADIGDKITAVLTNAGMTTGTTAWDFAGNLLHWASGFSPLSYIGQGLDSASGALGNGLLSSPLVGGLVGACVVWALWLARKSGGRGSAGWVAMGKVILVAAFLAVSVLGATKTTGTADGGTHYGFLSPGWIADRSTTIAQDITGPIVANVSGSEAFAAAGGEQATQDLLSCNTYMAGLATLRSDVGLAGSPLSQASTTWQDSALSTWKQYQVGDTALGEQAWCHLLEAKSGITVRQQGAVWAAIGRATGQSLPEAMTSPNESDPPQGFRPQLSGDGLDLTRAGVAYAACTLVGTTWGVKDEFAARSEITGGECEKFWTTPGSEYLLNSSPFNIAEKDNEVRAAVGGGDAYDYILHLYGSTSSGISPASGTAYSVSGIVGVGVYGLVSGLVVANATTVVISVLGIVFVLFAALIPGRFGSSAIKRLAIQFFGAVLLTSGYTILLAIIALLARLLSTVGTSFGGGGFGTQMLSAFAPLISLFSVRQVTKRIFGKDNNPLSMRGAMRAVGTAAAGAAGGAALAKGTEAIRNRGRSAASKAVPGDNRAADATRRRIRGGGGGGSRDGSGSQQGRSKMEEATRDRKQRRPAKPAPTKSREAPDKPDSTMQDRHRDKLRSRRSLGDRTLSRAVSSSVWARGAWSDAKDAAQRAKQASLPRHALDVSKMRKTAVNARAVAAGGRSMAATSGAKVADGAKGIVRRVRNSERLAAAKHGRDERAIQRSADNFQRAERRKEERRQQFHDRPLRAAVKTVAKPVGLAAATVATAGVAGVAYAGYRGVRAARHSVQDRRAARVIRDRDRDAGGPTAPVPPEAPQGQSRPQPVSGQSGGSQPGRSTGRKRSGNPGGSKGSRRSGGRGRPG